MSDMVRKQIYIYQRQEALLKRLARLRGVSEAEIIRAAIDREANQPRPVNSPPDHSAWEEILEFVTQRQELGITHEPYHWNRAEIYAERENRILRDRPQEDA